MRRKKRQPLAVRVVNGVWMLVVNIVALGIVFTFTLLPILLMLYLSIK